MLPGMLSGVVLATRPKYRYLRLGIANVFSAGAGAGFWSLEYSEDGGQTIVPSVAMTANNAPSPLVASASSEYPGGYQAFRLFDNNAGTRWSSNPNAGAINAWVTLDLGAAGAIAPNWLRYGNVNFGGYDGGPTALTLWGSNSGAFAGEQAVIFSGPGTAGVADKTLVTMTW